MNTTKDLRSTLTSVRADVDAALKAIADKHGLKSLKLGKITFNDNNFKGALEGVFAEGKTKEATRYELEQRYDSSLPPLGYSFTVRGESYTVTGMNTIGSKVHALAANGKTYLFPTAALKNIYGRAK